MDKMEYDPEGGNYKPITEHETGATFLVLGAIMLLGLSGVMAAGWLLPGREREVTARSRCATARDGDALRSAYWLKHLLQIAGHNPIFRNSLTQT